MIGLNARQQGLTGIGLSADALHLDPDDLMLNQLRKAIRANQISFPSQVPTFTKQHRPEIEWQFVQLYFVLGWGPTAIARRYACTREYVRQILTQWKRHAVTAGYLQTISPAAMEEREAVAS